MWWWGRETDRQTKRGVRGQRALVVFMYLRTAMVTLKVQESHGGGACRLSEHNMIDFKDHSIKCQ